jgi:GTP-binding protein
MPNLGVMKLADREIIIADIPGIIKGASTGAGLGIQFLKHISRTLLIVLLVDVSEDTFLDAVEVLRNELKGFSEDLLTKSSIIVGTKCDIEGTATRFQELKAAFPDGLVLGISSITGKGLETLKRNLLTYLVNDVKIDDSVWQ